MYAFKIHESSVFFYRLYHLSMESKMCKFNFKPCKLYIKCHERELMSKYFTAGNKAETKLRESQNVYSSQYKSANYANDVIPSMY